MCEASKATLFIVHAVEKAYRSAVFAGIVPDPRHLRHGGYHCCLNHLLQHGNGDDYSNRRHLDETGAVSERGRGFACAFDISLSTADMKLLHSRVRKVFLDHGDPRRHYINAVNCWDGSGDAVRYDFQANTASWASPDHTWHTHGDQPRAYVDTFRNEGEAMKGARAYASVMTGEAKAAWTAREEPKPPAKPPAKPAAKPTPAPAPRKPLPAPKPITYRVVGGDSLWKIAHRFGVSITQLQAWNGIHGDVIQPGQVLRLAAPPKPTRHTVVKGDTLWAISKQFKVSVPQLKTWNALKSDNIFPGQILRIA